MSSNILISLRPNNIIRHLPWKLDSQAALGFLLIMATFSLVGWLYLTQASAVTTTSYRIDELRLELDQLRNQNSALTLEIAELQALSYVEGRARQLGLGPTNSVRYLSVSNYPVGPKQDLSVYGPVNQDYHRPAVNKPEFGPSVWWTDTMDTVTAWLVGE
jgi:hypothetical protein